MNVCYRVVNAVDRIEHIAQILVINRKFIARHNIIKIILINLYDIQYKCMHITYAPVSIKEIVRDDIMNAILLNSIQSASQTVAHFHYYCCFFIVYFYFLFILPAAAKSSSRIF